MNQQMVNIKGAFAIKRGNSFKIIQRFISKISSFPQKASGNLIEGKRILLIDDVLTTGITTNECACVLKEKGAAYVGIVTVAKTLSGLE